MELALTVAVVGAFATIAVAMLHGHYRSLKPSATEYCTHPSYQPKVRAMGGAEFACQCPRCHDRAVIVAANETAARSEYAHHPCSPQ